MKKWFSAMLAAVLLGNLLGCSSGGSPGPQDSAAQMEQESAPTHTYREAIALLSDNWNPHTALSYEENHPNQYLSRGLYSLVFNDSIHPVEGRTPFTCYTVIPEMAEGMPEDITDTFRQDHPEFRIPEDRGCVYRIALNPKACWETGKPINARTYADSFQRLLDPGLQNACASDLYSGELVIAGAEDYLNQGKSMVLSLQDLLQKSPWGEMDSLLKELGSQPASVNWGRSLGAEYDFEDFPWKPGQAVNPEGFCLPGEDRRVETPLTVAQMTEFLTRYLRDQGLENPEPYLHTIISTDYSYPQTVDFSQVGVIASGEYELTLVLARPLTGFRLLYSLTTNWLVEPELYDSCIREKDGVLTCSYGTSRETTLSYGPYRLAELEPGKSMTFLRNDSWYGYSDSLHRFEDPRDHLTYRMYQTDRVETLVMEDAADQKNEFLQGRLSVYGLQLQDFGAYRNSRYCYADPSEMVLYLILNGHMEAIRQREQAEDFDPALQDLETMTLPSFRRAIAESIDREVFAAAVSPARTGAYGIIGEPYLCDPETGTRYRDTDQAKQVLCRFYGVDPANYGGDLQAAEASILGYDTQAARELFAEAFREALEAGYITDEDGNGISDQTVTMEFCVDVDSDFKDGILNFLNQELLNVTRGTPFENRVRFVKSQPYGNGWYDVFCAGQSDLVLAGWTGSLMNPFALTELFTDGESQYDGAWFDASQVPMTLVLAGEQGPEELTMSLRQWSEALNGVDVKLGDGICNFGEQRASQDLRLTILAGIEEKILETCNYIPILQDASMHLLSSQVSYVVEQYHPVMARGGLQYLRYRYSDREWELLVEEQGGHLQY